MRKSDLLERLEEGIVVEEEIVPLLARTVEILIGELHETAFSGEKKQAIKERLDILIEESTRHKEDLLDLMRMIQRSAQDEF